MPNRRADIAHGSAGKAGSARERGATPAKRAAIIAATVSVLAREGLAETTTRKIAAEAGVNQAMISYYFGGKDELLFAALQDMMDRTADIARATLVDDAAPEHALASAITAFWNHVESEYALQIMQYELTLYALRRPESAWLAREQYAGYTEVVSSLAREAFAHANRKCAVPYDQLARFIVGGLDGLILQYVSDSNQERARRDLENLIYATIALATGTLSASAPRASAGRPLHDS